MRSMYAWQDWTAPADLAPTPSPPKGWGYRVRVLIGLGSSWSGPTTCKVEIDHTRSFFADLHIGGAAIDPYIYEIHR